MANETSIHHPGMDTHLSEGESNGLPLSSITPVNIDVRNLSIKNNSKPSRISRLLPFSRASPDYKKCSAYILNNVSAHMPSGSLTAILGASGSGKTSLLHTLSQRLTSGPLERSGQILYSGTTTPKRAGAHCAYLAQQDALAPTLTVRETLYYAAELRLPPPTTAEERLRVIDEVIRELGLRACANTRIGNDERQGCSGGEKRRTSLGVQLLGNPSVLLLDEMTTGLDVTTALYLVKTLQQLARRGRNVIISIHQPRSDMWELFDNVVLLYGGCTVYSGPREDCLEHFESLGYPLPRFKNPAEYLIDLATVDSRSQAMHTASQARLDLLKTSWAKVQEVQQPPRDGVSVSSGTNHHHSPSPKRASWVRQLRVQTLRTFKTSYRDPMCVAASLVECISIGILTGWIFFQLDGSQASLRSRWGALYTAAALQNFLVLLFETYRLTCEIDIFDRERAEDVVGVSSFLLSRRLARALIEDIPVPLIYSGIFYLMVGLRREAARFFVFFAVVLLSHYTAVTFAMLAVALFRDFAGASLIVNLNFTLQSLCSGFFIQSDQIPVWVRWMKWTAYTWYANGALVTNEFIGGSIEPEGYLYDCPHPGGTSNPACAPWTGRYVVVLLGFPQHNWIFRPILILLGFTCAFSILAGFIFSCFKQEIRMSRSRSPIETNASTKILAARPPAPLQALGITLRNLSLDFEKVHLLTRKREVVTILEPVRMLFEPGILNAIMGPSGAGKTSLLKLMAQRNSGTHWGRRYHSTGTMLLGNTIPTKSVIRSMVSYVSQTDDNLLPNLTVRETLYFAAQLRLATWISPSDKKKRAESIMHKLGLSHCANTLIGNEFIKGISGGEKRRVSIAVQMLMEPRILLLDEPTASLDSFTASALIDTLHDLAREGCTVVFTIHQPTSDMFHRFGSVLLLGRGGDTAYAGPREEMLPYFTSLGYNCPIDTNPVDFILDLISADDQSSSRELSSKENVRVLIDTWKSRFSNSHEAVNPVEVATLPAQLNAFTRTPMPLFTATMLLLRRSSICLSRSPSAILARTGQVTGFAIILVVFFTPLRKNDTSVQSRVGFMQEVVAVYFIGMLQNVAVFPGEKAVFDAEARDGTYGVEPFLIAYTALEVPFEIFAAVLFGVLMTFIVGLPRSGEVFGVMSFVCFSLVNCGESVGMMSNTLFKSTGFAVSVTSVVLSLGLIMSGVLSTDLPPVLDAVNYISPCKWAVSVMATYTLRNVRFSCSDAKSNADGSCLVENGQDIIRLYNLFDSRLSLLYLAILVMGYRALAYILLKTFKR